MSTVIENSRLSLNPRGRALSPEVAGVCVGVLDVLMVLIPALAIYLGYVGWSVQNYQAYTAIAVATSVVTVTVFYLSDLYRLNAIAKPSRQLHKILPLVSLVFLTFIAFLFALKISAELSRVWVFSWFLTSLALILTGRAIVSHLLLKAADDGNLGRNIIVVGGGTHGQRLVNHLSTTEDPWNNVVGVFDDRSTRVGLDVGGRPLLGNLDDLLDYAREHRCDEIIVALPWSADKRVGQIINVLRVLPVHVSLGPDLAALNFLPASFRECAGVPVLRVLSKPIAGGQAMLKRIEDFVLGTILTLISVPLMLMIALMIKLSGRGPVLFRQARYGFNNQLINVYKFRTMYTDKTDEKGQQLTTEDDPRVTRIGRFLRLSSLDELPQFFNVLKGEMSIVGPRPHALEAKAGSRLYQDVVAEYAARHRVKPGITGWAQVNGWRGETHQEEQIEQRVLHDLHYIENWSLGLDFKIILRTVGTVLSARNAL